MILVGGFVYAPICTYWLIYLNPLYLGWIGMAITKFKLAGHWTRVWTSVAVDKLILTWPYLATMIFCASMWETRGNTMESLTEIKEKLWPSVKANWVFWPACMALIYGFVPRFFRSVADAAFGCIWSGILSYVWHLEDENKKENATEED